MTHETEAGRALFERLTGLATESRNPGTTHLDTLSAREIVDLVNAEDATVADAVKAVLDDVARAVDLVADAIGAGGRLLYVGAGTSGRLGVLDAAECPPTFGSDPRTVVGIIAGGTEALVRAVEGAEDRTDTVARALDELDVGPGDVVLGIAASWRTPYTVAGVRHAQERGARTIFLTTNDPARVEVGVDVLIAPQVGPEVLMGSTRMKSGTAQKMVLNMITTGAMVRLGKVYENMMVDLMATSAKLVERSKRVVMEATGLDYAAAADALSRAGGSVKRAVVMVRADASAEEADAALGSSGGHVRPAIRHLEGDPGRPGSRP